MFVHATFLLIPICVLYFDWIKDWISCWKYVENQRGFNFKYLPTHFFRYDSLTGVPSSQRTVAFEKASVLFNVGALYTQIGTKQNRSTSKGLDAAVDNFLRSAGTFQYILENFTNAPSMDLNPATLEFLVHLMCAQARECLFEKGELVLFEEDSKNKDGLNLDTDTCLALGQEAAHVSTQKKKRKYAVFPTLSNCFIAK